MRERRFGEALDALRRPPAFMRFSKHLQTQRSSSADLWKASWTCTHVETEVKRSDTPYLHMQRRQHRHNDVKDTGPSSTSNHTFMSLVGLSVFLQLGRCRNSNIRWANKLNAPPTIQSQHFSLCTNFTSKKELMQKAKEAAFP